MYVQSVINDARTKLWLIRRRRRVKLFSMCLDAWTHRCDDNRAILPTSAVWSLQVPKEQATGFGGKMSRYVLVFVPVCTFMCFVPVSFVSVFILFKSSFIFVLKVLSFLSCPSSIVFVCLSCVCLLLSLLYWKITQAAFRSTSLLLACVWVCMN